MAVSRDHEMAKVHPYHTDFEEHPAEHWNVYYDRDDCPAAHPSTPS
jgi:hypothetical protein